MALRWKLSKMIQRKSTVKFVVFSGFIAFILLLVSSCFSIGITKRQHTSGYHISLYERPKQATIQSPSKAVQENYRETETVSDAATDMNYNTAIHDEPNDIVEPENNLSKSIVILNKGLVIAEKIQKKTTFIAPVSSQVLKMVNQSQVADKIRNVDSQSIQLKKMDGFEITVQVLGWIMLIAGGILLYLGLSSDYAEGSGCLFSILGGAFLMVGLFTIIGGIVA